MLPHQERVVLEKQELDNKIDKLYVFIKSEKYKELDLIDQQLLATQFSLMLSYSATLSRRIETFQPITKEQE